MKQEFENIRSTVKCNEIDNLNLPLGLETLYCLSTEMFFDNDNLPVFLEYFPCLTSRTERTSASEDQARVLCRNAAFTGSYFAFASVNKTAAFSQFDHHSDKSFENSIENILNHPYLYSIYVSCINNELFLFEPKFVLVLRLTRLSNSRRLAFIPQA